MHWAKATASVSLFLVATGCTTDPVRRDVQRVMDRTTPVGATTLDLRSFTRSPGGADAEWTFELTSSWATYRKWAIDQLLPDYACTVDPEAIRCLRLFEADRYSLTLTPSQSGAVVAVRAVFAARPR